MNDFINHLENIVDWDRVFGVVNSLYLDKGFTSNADNFARATMVEKALDKFSNLERVDKNGYDFLFNDKKVELKMGKNLFYKRKDPNATKKFKVKSFLSETKTVEDFKQISTYDYLLVIDLTAKRVVVVNDEHARSLYTEGADGAMISLNKGDYYECNLPEINVIEPPVNLSVLYNKADQQFLSF
tara:strand:- start:166 stop:720 length:555 start_codon:yes stop_codon:yes gene_type:complete